MKKFLRSMKSNFGVVGEFFGFLWKRRLFVLIPMIALLMMFALLIVFGNASGLAPFIYTLF